MAPGQGGFGGMAMPGGHARMGGPIGGNVLQPHGGGGMNASDVVHTFLKERGVGVPVSVPAIVQGLGGQLGDDAVKAAIADLESKGFAYNANGDQYAAC